jgi:hypothetical protein
VGGPHLIVAPLSVLSSWMTEFKRFCPELKVIKLHSSDPTERDRLKNSIKRVREAALTVWAARYTHTGSLPIPCLRVLLTPPPRLPACLTAHPVLRQGGRLRRSGYNLRNGEGARHGLRPRPPNALAVQPFALEDWRHFCPPLNFEIEYLLRTLRRGNANLFRRARNALFRPRAKSGGRQ